MDAIFEAAARFWRMLTGLAVEAAMLIQAPIPVAVPEMACGRDGPTDAATAR